MNDALKPARYQHLGLRAFWLFFFQKSKFIFTVILAMVALTIVRRVFVLPDDALVLIDQALLALVGVFVLVFVGALTIAFFQYLAYEFVLDEHALKIRSGILNVQIEAIPYRQMQNIDIERDILYRLLGISRLVILTAGTEDKTVGDESEGIIPALDKHLAAHMQEELLKRANVEKVSPVALQ